MSALRCTHVSRRWKDPRDTAFADVRRCGAGIMAASVQSAVVESISAPKPGQFRLQTERVEKLAAKLENAGDPEIRAAALDLVQSVIELHGAALGRMIDSLSRTAEGEEALNEALSDDLVASMLLLHG